MNKTKIQLDENNNEMPPLKKRRKNLREIVSQPETGETQLCHKHVKQVQSEWAYLPAEVLAQIFEYLVKQDTGMLPCLLRLSKVCRHWRNTANIPFLWSDLHFAPYLVKSQQAFKKNIKSFELMAEAHFSSVESLTCSGFTMIAPVLIKTVLNYARKILILSIQRCGSISTKNCLQTVADRHSSSLQQLCISHTSIPTSDIRKILSGAGEQLTHLELFNPEFPRDIQISLIHLRNLNILKIECGRSFNISNIKSLKHLRVLHLTNMHLDTRGCLEVEFPELEDLDLSINEYCTANEPDNQMLALMMSKSRNIRNVNLSNRRMDVACLIPSLENCLKIEVLDISGFYGSSLSALLLHLSGSLKEIHLDYYDNLNARLCSCADILYWQSISILSMCHTNISGMVLEMLTCFSNIQEFNLDVCRYLPRGCRRRWKKKEMPLLKARLLDANASETLAS
ncbi:F-box/LRR-repeat protein 6-like [Styela clava]